jgi:ATP-binding cassette subfamily F protein 3
MIHLKSISLSYGDQVIFNDITATVDQHQRVGLIGRNGSGKSTLLKVIAGMIRLDKGSVQLAGSKKIAYMPQEVVLSSKKVVFEEAFSAFAELAQLQKESRKLEQQLENLSEKTTDNTSSNKNTATAHDAHAALLDRYAQVSQALSAHNPTQATLKTEQVLTGLGFSTDQLKQPTNELSVGWQMRLVLAKLLLTQADFYLFDEPTNHLDIVAKDWFLQFLKDHECGFLLVCHDRYFLDQVCTHMFELELGKGTLFRGSFSAYEKHKELVMQQLEAAYEQQQREIRQKEALINRFRAKATKASMTQSMIKALDKIERITLPPAVKSITVTLAPAPRSVKTVLTVHDVSHTFAQKTIFTHAQIQIERGEKVALVAPNGVGKTTLFNIIAGKIPLQKGSVQLGAQVIPALFAQDQAKVLDGSKTILENVQQRCPKVYEQTIRSLLGSFLFGAQEIEKPVSVLSGGEKNRVGMVCVLLHHANFLLLDEPTNNLDIPSKEILLKALLQFDGTIFFVSHDHDFVNRLATRVIELSPTGTTSYHGNYQDYLYQKQYRSELEKSRESREQESYQKAHAPTYEHRPAGSTENVPLSSQKEPRLDGAQLFALRKQVKKLEIQIDKLEQEIAILEENFAHLTYGTPEFENSQKRLHEYKQKLETYLQEWELAQEKLT